MLHILQDVRFGLRMLFHSRGLTFVAIVALALGIGANTAIFSVVNAVLVRPLPYPEPNELVWFWESQPHLSEAPFSAADFLDFQSQNSSFSEVAAVHRLSFNLTGLGPAERIPAMVASTPVFSLLGVQPILGRAFLPAEGTFGAPRVALLTYGFWQSHFGGDRAAVGKTITLDNQSVQIIGVLPASFRYGNGIQLWVNPVNIVPEIFSAFADWERKLSTDRENHYLNIIGRLKPGVPLSQAQADISGIMDRIRQQHSEATGHAAQLIPFSELFTGPVRQTLLVLLGVVALVLLIACANVANLLLARSVGRRREIAVRSALGAGRFRIVSQLLTESTLLSLSGGALGLALAAVLLHFLVAASPRDLPRVQEVSLDLRVLGFTLSVSLLTGLVFGLAPSLAAGRQSLGEFLKEGSRGSTGGVAHNRLRSLLVVGEVALSIVLLVASGLLIRSFVEILHVKPGFNSDHIITMWMNFTSVRYSENVRSTQLLDQLLPRIAALPGVEGVAISNDLPLEGDDTTTGIAAAEGRPPFERAQRPIVGVHTVSPSYFRSMGIPLLRGRELAVSDTAKSNPVVIINQKLAEDTWPRQDPLGRHITILGDKQLEVVGIVGNVLHNGLSEPVQAESYMAFSQNPSSYVGLAIRSRGDHGALFSAVRSIVAELDPELPVHDMRPMERVVAETLATRRLTLWLVGAFGALALMLSSVGIYGVMSYAVTERAHEIGVRTALGAQREDIFRLFVGSGMRLAGIGLVIGAAAAFLAARTMTSLLFGVSASDPVTYLVIATLLALAAFAACYVPARRALAVDPIVALRCD
ncbi:MAG TPA: ABC transporter permease [Candidatus Eisenbacteria bacterium]|nr:ABC transporter permease [Candidatus Eisenbacteria bacterium]